MDTWLPDDTILKTANIAKWMQELGYANVTSFHQWSYTEYEAFWQKVVSSLPILFKQPATKTCALRADAEHVTWFPNAQLNIVDSCFQAPDDTPAFIYLDESQLLKQMTYGELRHLVQRISYSLQQAGIQADDAVGLVMAMNPMACAIYLAIIHMGGVVVSVADSFSASEIALRFKIAKVKIVFTQNTIGRNSKVFSLYEKVKMTECDKIIVHQENKQTIDLRQQDALMGDFLQIEQQLQSVSRDPMAALHILFSSGTTGEPKAIVWNHTTPIRVASDAYFHQNIKPGDVLAWPTNLGWMMGPWLLFAGLMHKATVALYTDSPKERAFGEFVQQAKVTMLGIVPTIVAAWRQSHCMQDIDFSSIKVFSSSGECSNAGDMQFLMQLGGNKPVIEYCGGTEIGGAYISSTVVQKNIPAEFSTPTIGTRIVILDTEGNETNKGEVAIVPPTIGLSTTLINADHHRVYFANMPKASDGAILRRHGDEVERLANGYYRVLGRVDDTMNLGGIKISAAEIERALAGMDDIVELAAIALPPSDNGPTRLIIVAATDVELSKDTMLPLMQKRINTALNPLFRISDIVFMKELPKTASNKIMRRTLRDALM